MKQSAGNINGRTSRFFKQPKVVTPISRTYIFDKSTDDFFMKFYRTRETDGSAGQTFDSGSQGQIVTLNVLSKNLTSQMLLLR